MSYREVLEAALAKPWPQHWEKNSIIAAARERLAQLPEKCGTCGGTGIAGTFSHIHQETGTHLGDEDITCPTCHGSGKVYPAELVERLAEAIDSISDEVWGFRGWQAVAVLDALNRANDG